MRRARIRWSDCVFQLARERLGMLLEELDEVPGEREVRAPLPDSCHCDLTPDRAEEADGRTDGLELNLQMNKITLDWN